MIIIIIIVICRFVSVNGYRVRDYRCSGPLTEPFSRDFTTYFAVQSNRYDGYCCDLWHYYGYCYLLNVNVGHRHNLTFVDDKFLSLRAEHHSLWIVVIFCVNDSPPPGILNKHEYSKQTSKWIFKIIPELVHVK